MNRYFIILFATCFVCYSLLAKSMKVYKHVDNRGVTHYSSKKPEGVNFKILNIRCPECTWKNKVNWRTTPLILDKYEHDIQKYAKRFNLKPSLIKAIIHAESSFKPEVQSSAGAQGLMQLMPATQERYAVNNPYDPTQNIQGGTAYLKHLLNKYNNNLNLSLAAYNAGETAVAKYNNKVPPYDETKNYIKRINILRKRYKN